LKEVKIINTVMLRKILDAIYRVMRHGFGYVTIEIKDCTITKISIAVDEKVA
jgi:hypothetical protein